MFLHFFLFQDEKRAADHLSRLLFVALACGIAMFVSTLSFAEPLLRGNLDVFF
jgi:Na+-driven multidrug efflux pump